MRVFNVVVFFVYLAFSSELVPVAQAEGGSDLCPENFPEALVTTGHVDCFRVTSTLSDRDAVELLRLQREAECLAEPRSELIRSEIIVRSNGQFQASLTCRINLVVPNDTILCPDGSVEVYRAFNFMACRYFGSASLTLGAANTALASDTSACLAAEPAGQVLSSAIQIAESADDDEPFFFTNVDCGFEIPAIDVFECPIGFDEEGRTEDELRCEREDFGLPDLEQANSLNDQVQAICTDTTAGLGSVEGAEISFDDSSDTFSLEVDCDIALPRFGEFSGDEVVRACDATCTEDIEQTRQCINGDIGDPGCTEAATQILVEDCNTGTLRTSACPVLGIPAANIVPLLLLDEEDGE